jgi:hypothetical protein
VVGTIDAMMTERSRTKLKTDNPRSSKRAIITLRMLTILTQDRQLLRDKTNNAVISSSRGHVAITKEEVRVEAVAEMTRRRQGAAIEMISSGSVSTQIVSIRQGTRSTKVTKIQITKTRVIGVAAPVAGIGVAEVAVEATIIDAVGTITKRTLRQKRATFDQLKYLQN